MDGPSRWTVVTGGNPRRFALLMVGAAALLVIGLFQHAWGVVAFSAAWLILTPAMAFFRSRSDLSNSASANIPQRLIGTAPTWGLPLLVTVFLVLGTVSLASEGNVANAIFGAVGAVCSGILFVAAVVFAIKGRLPMP